MTERVRIEHTFDCSEKGFWDTFLNSEYNRLMFLESMNFPRWEVVKQTEDQGVVTRTVEVEPYVGPLPIPVKKVLGDKIQYREDGRFIRVENRYLVKITPASLASKILVSGTQFTEALGEDRCKRIFEATIDVKLFAIGSLIEKLISADLRKSYDAGAIFTQSYLREHKVR